MKEHYRTFLRAAVALSAIGLWVISINFSSDGFAFIVPNMLWAGIVLALVVTVFELLFNQEGAKLSSTLVIGSLLAYGYGIGTNIIGIAHARGVVNLDIGNMLFPFILGTIVEIVPEPMMLWALFGETGNDLLSHIFRGTS